ncbi:hypothetical protein D9619_006763 [Psilocybe cf. subviscida]|uniref:F-box domain-containing protein n=1 Tax=Psilocybe cf. subviscida TaxID=2480587 RepID=A0A8H5B5X7_9AGAR|nr:hypothetical protein D9619_006763 [Psilocybe cf. subviscida]
MASLPPEMWHEILRYIPAQSTYPKLLTVNSVVFHILGQEVEEPRELTFHRDPAVAARVHSMDLDISLSNEPIDDILALLSSCLIHLVNITKFSSSILTQGGLKPICVRLRPLFEDIWASFGPRLGSLTLGVGVSQYAHFALDRSRLSGINSLYLCLYWANPTDPDGSSRETLLATTILPCLLSVKNQLQSLGLTFLAPINDSSAFFTKMRPFPHLRSVSLLPPSNATLQSISCALENCSAVLQTLNLNLAHLPIEGIDMGEISGCLRHSRVQTLIIQPQSPSANSLRGADSVGKLIYMVQETVTSVVARTNEWSTTEEFFSLFAALATCPLLEHLEIQINCLDTVVMGQLAQSLPRLKTLVVLHRMHYRSPQHESMFNALEEEEYSTWELKSLSIYRNTRTTPDRSEQPPTTAYQAVQAPQPISPCLN